MIYALATGVRTCFYPIISSEGHIFAFPLQHYIVSARSRPLFDYLFLRRPCIFKFSVRSKTIEDFFSFLLSLQGLGCHNAIECVHFNRNRSMGSRRWLNRSSFLYLFSFFFVFFNPKLMSSFVEFEVRDIIMRIIKAHSRHILR